MKWRRRLGSAWQPLFAHRMRSVLAMSGVAVGAAAVIVARAVGAGAQQEMVRTVERAGNNLLIVKPLPVKRLVSRPQVSGYETSLRLGDADEIARMPFLGGVAPTVERMMRVKVGTLATKTTVRGTTTGYLAVRNFALARGRCFDASDDRAARRVAVVGARVEQALTPGNSLLGQEIRVGGVPFDVIGVLEAKGTSSDGADQDNQVLVPLRTALRRVFNTPWLTSIYVGVAEPARLPEVEAEIRRVVWVRHQKGAGERPADFAVQNTTNLRAFQQQMTEALGRYATWLAAFALAIGGVGIMAFMLLSVRERTGEIGLRMAIGAQPRDILLQFLIEAGGLALAGWIAGALLAAIVGAVVRFGTAWPVSLPASAILVSFGMSMIIGLGFGAVPARNAARIPPIQALLQT